MADFLGLDLDLGVDGLLGCKVKPGIIESLSWVELIKELLVVVVVGEGGFSENIGRLERRLFLGLGKRIVKGERPQLNGLLVRLVHNY